MSTSPAQTFFIITPSFNQASFLEQTITSVLSQTKVQVKYAVIDGGSTDGSVEILKKYSKHLYWVSEKDKGQTDAINKGIQWIQAQQKKKKIEYFFGYLNSDDYLLGEESLWQVAQQFHNFPQKKWLVGDAKIVNERGQEVQSLVKNYKMAMRRIFKGSALQVLNPIPQPATFLRDQVIQQLGIFDPQLRYTMDYEYWLRTYQQFGNPIFYQKQLAAFRIHQTSKGGSQFEKQFQEEVQVAQEHGVHGVTLSLHKIHAWLTVNAYHVLK